MDNQSLSDLRTIAKIKGLSCYSHMNKQELSDYISCVGSNPNSVICRPKVKWTIYTKEGCPYCKNAKELLRNNGYNFKETIVTQRNMSRIYSKIDSQTDSYRYFPVIFLNDKFIGGYSELSKIFS